MRVRASALCGSDLHTLAGRRPSALPVVLGHETCGEVVELGDGGAVDVAGRALAVGDRVVWALVASCGECRACRAGLPQKCEHGVKFGHARQAPDEPPAGGFAERVLLGPRTGFVAVPAGVDDAHAAIASCAVATAVAACRAAGPLADRQVLVHGAGLLGIAVIERARELGAAVVDVCERKSRRHALARRHGAWRVFADPAESACHEPGGGYDVAFECTGDPDAIAAQHRLLSTGGTQILLGSVFPTPPFATAPEQIVRRMLTIRGLHNYTLSDLADAIAWLAAQPGRFADCFGRWYALEEFARAADAAAIGDDLRVLVRPNEGGMQ
ncbi:MAG: alcohol dehydrogenase catalytic domain-containing protein [Planctomycetes bacterium]|nr:alcohol dehydrogenase catalytic domain-containing protein [Planctomycetota bacterium]